MEPPKPPPGEGTVATKRELPKWLRWETYGQCSHDDVCRQKMIVAAGAAIVALIVLAGWVGGKDNMAWEET